MQHYILNRSDSMQEDRIRARLVERKRRLYLPMPRFQCDFD